MAARLVFHENSSLRKGFGAHSLPLRRVRGVGRGLALCGQLRRMLFGKMVAHDAAADRAGHRMMSRVVTGNTADHRAFQTAGGTCGSGGAECERGGEQGGLDSALFHIGAFLQEVVIQAYRVGGIWGRPSRVQ